jgi:uncharacterized cupin superfamily protein
MSLFGSSEWRLNVKATLSELRQSIDHLVEHLEDDEVTDDDIEAGISNLVEMYMPHAAAMLERDGQSVVRSVDPAVWVCTVSKSQWTYEYLVSYELDGHTHVRYARDGREADRLEVELNRRGCTRVVSSGLTFDDLARYRRDVERARSGQGSMVIYDEAEG